MLVPKSTVCNDSCAVIVFQTESCMCMCSITILLRSSFIVTCTSIEHTPEADIHVRKPEIFGVTAYNLTILYFLTVVSDDAQCIPELHSVQSQPVCPGDNVVYSCTVQGTNATIWTGDAFFCPNQTLNATELSHFEPNATAECWPYMAMNNVTSHEDDCYTSILKFKAYVELNNTQILCLNAAGNETGNETFTLSSE